MKITSFWKGFISASVLALLITPVIIYKLSILTPSVFKEYQFTDLHGQKVDIAKLKGKAVVVNFWATWCPPCLHEMPSIVHAQQLLKDQNVVFLVASYEDVTKISAFKKDKNYPINFFHFSRIDGKEPSKSFPVTYIFNKEGKNVYSRAGAFTWDDEATIRQFKNWFR